MVVVLPATKEMCMIKKPITLKANAKFKTVVHDTNNKERLINRWNQNTIYKSIIKSLNILPNARKVVARVPGVPGISSSLKKAMKCGIRTKVTRVVSKNV